MMPSRPLTLLAAVIVLVVAQASAQDSRPTSAALKKKPTPLEKLMGAAEAERAEALIGFIEAQIATNAVYAGQYSVLRKLDWDVQKLLKEWISRAPRQVLNKDALRRACINALRDVVEKGKATDDLRDLLKQLAEDWFEDQEVRRVAAYALAQFGDRSLVDKAIAEATKKTQSEDVGNQAQGWHELANIHYNLRQYEDAIKSYRKLLEVAKGKLRLGPTVFYNCACSLALAGKKDQAFALLEQALKMNAGNLPESLLQTDMDIASLRKDERFPALMKQYFGDNKAAETKPKPGAEEPTSRPGDAKDDDKK